jgi:NAD(P)-dependent dehydrogenase (short-subunit alcohol dehydrogenase family)
MDLGIEDKAAIVTGGSKGIGKAIAETLAEEGARVAICARDEEELAAAAADIDGETLAVPTDVTDDGDVANLIEETVDAFGTVDILVNNVGVTGSFEPLDAVPRAEWESVIETTLVSAMAVTKAALPHIREDEWGRILNVASDAGVMPHGEMPQYNAAKAGMINLTNSLSRAYAEDGLTVNAIAPGTTKTPLVEQMMEDMAEERGITPAEAERAFLDEEKPLIDIKRFAEPEEIAAVAAFMVSDLASYVTGATYRAEGGGIPSINA